MVDFDQNSEIISVYCISLVMRQRFPFKNSPKNLDASKKLDLDFLDCFIR